MEEKTITAEPIVEKKAHHRKGKTGPRIRVIGYLDQKTRISCDSHCFMIQVKVEKEVNGENVVTWATKYYYSQIGDAIRGFAKYAIRMMDKKSSSGKKPLLDLLDVLAALDKKLDDVAKKVETEWKELQKDPIESAIIDELGYDPDAENVEEVD